MVNYNINRTSFTLIELIITVGFILLFTGFSVSYYTQFTEQKKLENASRKLSSVLQLARAKTISGDVSLCGIPAPARPEVSSYRVSIINGGEFKMSPDCLVGTPTPIYYLINSNINQNHVLFPTPTMSVSFNILTGNTECTYIYLKSVVLNGASGSCRYVKVSSTGLTTEDKCASCTTCLAPSPGIDECP